MSVPRHNGDFFDSLITVEGRPSGTYDKSPQAEQKGIGYLSPPFAHLPVIDDDMRREVEAVIGDAQTYAELIQVFLLEGEERLSDIERAIFEREETTALRVCHSLKGSCASIGVVRLVEMLAVLETDCGIGKWEYSIVSRLRTEWDAVRALLRPYAVPAHVD